MIILIDLDGVLNEFESELWSKLKKNHPNLKAKKRTTFKLSDQLPKLGQEITEIKEERGFIENLKPSKNAVNALKELEKLGHEIKICTSPQTNFKNSVLERYNWVEKHLGFEWTKKIILTKDKTLIKGDLLIDDNPEIKGSKVPEWEHIIFDRPYNKRHKNKRRTDWNNWKRMLPELLQFNHNHLYKPKPQNFNMEDKIEQHMNQPIKRIRKTSGWDASSTIVAFLLGIVAVLSIAAVFLMFEFTIALMSSLLILLILLLVILLITKPKRSVEIVYKNVPLKPIHRQELAIDEEMQSEDIQEREEGEFDYIGSKENKKYHKTDCRYANNIKPEYATYSNDPNFFKKQKYKPCKVCIKK